MQPHKAEQINELLDSYLPGKFSSKVIKKLKEMKDYDGKSDRLHIRHVRALKVKNTVVFSILIDLAYQEKENHQALRATANKALAMN